MATFTDTQIADFGEVFELDSDVLGSYLTYEASLITEAEKTKALAILAQWQAVKSKFTKINSVRFGANIDYNRNRAVFAKRMAAALHISKYLGSVGSGQTRLVRG